MRSFRTLLLLLLAGLPAASLPVLAQSADTTRITSEVTRRGFVALGEHERTNELAFASDAARAFAARVRSDPEDAWAHYGLALTLIRASKTMKVVRAEGVADGEAAKVAVRLLERAVELDPDFVEAAELLERAAERTNDRSAQARAYVVLEKHGRLHEPVAAPARPGALGLLDRARREFQRHQDAAGTELYLTGLREIDRAAAAEYITDALIVADSQEEIALTSGTLEKRAAALMTFWKKRSVRDGVAISDRIGEHYRRLAYARDRFKLPSSKHATRDIMGRKKTGHAAELDDRGPVYVRYGPPTEPAAWDVEQIGTGLKTWAYLNPDGRYTVFHFVASGDHARSVYQLTTNPLGNVRANAGPDAAAALIELARYEPRYAFLAARLTTVRNIGRASAYSENRQADVYFLKQAEEDIARLNERITMDNLNAVALAHQSDRAQPAFEQPLVVFQDFATFRGNGCTDLVYSVAVPASSYRVNVAVTDTFTWESQDVDQVVSKELPEGGYLRTTGVLCTMPDYNAFIRVTVAADSATGTTAGGDITIPDYAPRSGLLMSDMLFARQEDGGFVRGKARLALVPPRQFRQAEAFRVFYELYNMPRGNPYRTEITFETVRANVVARLFKGRSKTSVSFEDAAVSDGVVQELRTLIPEVEPGEVRVTIKVTDLRTRTSASAHETIRILPAD